MKYNDEAKKIKKGNCYSWFIQSLFKLEWEPQGKILSTWEYPFGSSGFNVCELKSDALIVNSPVKKKTLHPC